MKAIISAMITCAVIFGLSAGATQFLLKKPPVDLESTEADVSGEESTGLLAEDMVDGGGDAVPVSFRPDNNVSVEAVLQMSDSIKRMEQELAEREERVKRDEMRVKLIFDDLTTEQDELRAFSEGIDTKLDLLSRMTEELKSTLANVEQQKAELEKLSKKAETKKGTTVSSVDSQADEVKGWFEGLQPEQAADYLREFSNNGKMGLAASLLQKMPDRQKSKILGAMNDPILVNQLIETLTKDKRN
ncbi:hypothetical protein Mal15_16700 [Stieleria maiorica]|uniref:Magnesium transporter MgtE intracellular domain-containing protein n=1 Tax=Stieleria maiorica TaxID=2795974 RepID=A0A5B9MAT1_9BACT|nr:hypothetical protein [Stieleria maiorica]QEF97629.1 hypothetical protein Mal15_16700 [Stieleria maiorica]